MCPCVRMRTSGKAVAACVWLGGMGECTVTQSAASLRSNSSTAAATAASASGPSKDPSAGTFMLFMKWIDRGIVGKS